MTYPSGKLLCPKCNNNVIYAPQYGKYYCFNCRAYVNQPIPEVPPPPPADYYPPVAPRQPSYPPPPARPTSTSFSPFTAQQAPAPRSYPTAAPPTASPQPVRASQGDEVITVKKRKIELQKDKASSTYTLSPQQIDVVTKKEIVTASGLVIKKSGFKVNYVKCPRCKKAVEDMHETCQWCGRMLIPKQVILGKPEPYTLKCYKCQKDVLSDYISCPSCGVRLLDECKMCYNPVRTNYIYCTTCGIKLEWGRKTPLYEYCTSTLKLNEIKELLKTIQVKRDSAETLKERFSRILNTIDIPIDIDMELRLSEDEINILFNVYSIVVDAVEKYGDSVLEPAAQLKLAHFLLKNGKEEDARALYENALSYLPENNDIWYYIGQTYEYRDSRREFESIDPKKAIECYDAVLKEKPDSIRALVNKAIDLRIMKEYKKAEKTHQAILMIEKNNAVAWKEIALCAYEQKKYSSAMKSLQKAITLDPMNIRLRKIYAEVSISEKNYMEAYFALKSYLAQEPDNVDVLYLLAEVCYNIQRYHESYDTLNYLFQRISFHKKASELKGRIEDYFRKEREKLTYIRPDVGWKLEKLTVKRYLSPLLDAKEQEAELQKEIRATYW